MNGLLKSAYMKVSRVLSPQCSFPSMTSQEEEEQRGRSTANKSGLIKDQTRGGGGWQPGNGVSLLMVAR